MSIGTKIIKKTQLEFSNLERMLSVLLAEFQ